MTGYTKERWIVGKDGNIYDLDGGRVATVPVSGYRRDRGLMLAAAPEMYNALYDIAMNYDCDDSGHRHGTGCRKCMAHEAIAGILQEPTP